MQVISQENYPLTKVSSVSLRPSNIRFEPSITLSLTKQATLASVAALAIIISLRKARKNYYGGNGYDNNDNAMNDNNHRTQIDRFKGVEASFGRENDWSLAMETSRRLMVDFFPHHLLSDGSIQPTDKLFHSPRGY